MLKLVKPADTTPAAFALRDLRTGAITGRYTTCMAAWRKVWAGPVVVRCGIQGYDQTVVGLDKSGAPFEVEVMTMDEREADRKNRTGYRLTTPVRAAARVRRAA